MSCLRDLISWSYTGVLWEILSLNCRTQWWDTWPITVTLVGSPFETNQSSPAVLVKACRLPVPQEKSSNWNHLFPMHSVALFPLLPDLRDGSLSPVNSQKITLLLQSPAVKFITNLSSSLYCTPIMWVFPHTEGLGWLLARPETQLCKVIGQIKEDSILTQARGWGGWGEGVGAGNRKEKRWFLLFSWVSPREKLDLGILYLLWVFVRFKWVNVSESIWKQRCIFIIVEFFKGTKLRIDRFLQPESFYKITFIKESLK